MNFFNTVFPELVEWNDVGKLTESSFASWKPGKNELLVELDPSPIKDAASAKDIYIGGPAALFSASLQVGVSVLAFLMLPSCQRLTPVEIAMIFSTVMTAIVEHPIGRDLRHTSMSGMPSLSTIGQITMEHMFYMPPSCTCYRETLPMSIIINRSQRIQIGISYD